MERYFLGGNTSEGFRGYFDSETERIGRVVLLKGGPGTGKSSLMKAVGRECARRGLDHELWLCSGDPESVDGIYIKDADFAVTDATAPHAADARLPVIRESVIDMAAALDREKLLGARTKIEKLLSAKKEAYIRAYEHLGRAYGYYLRMKEEYAKRVPVTEIRRRAAAFALRGQADGNADAEERNLFASAITANGTVSFYDYLAGKRLYKVGACEIGADIFLAELATLMRGKTLIHAPLNAAVTDGVAGGDWAVVRDAGAFASAADTIDLSDLEGGASYNCEFYRSRKDEEIRTASADLSAARQAHLECEKYFTAAMDFSVTDEITGRVFDMIFG